MKQLIKLFFFTLTVFTGKLFAQPYSDKIPTHETFKIESRQVSETRTINIWLPENYKTSSDSFPVLYMPDGGINEDFPHIANTLEKLIDSNEIKPVILVGIENTQRRKDLTGPTVVEKDKEIAPVVGGSEQFRAFISEELIPEINRRYRTTNKKGIIGESLAGLFVTETLLLKPGLFDFYIAFDPSLWWNDQYLVKNAKAFLTTPYKTNKIFWFAGSNTKMIFKPATKLSNILDQTSLPNLSWKFSPEKKEKHNTIFRAAKVKAITWTLTQALGNP